MANYPPYLEGKLPAQYGRVLKIPFTVNRAYSPIEEEKLIYYVKTTTTSVRALTSSEASEYSKNPKDTATYQIDKTTGKGLITITIPEGEELIPGLFYKIQLSFGNSGYNSNVGVFKYTHAPELTIQSSGPVVTGTYSNSDKTEKVEYYKFDIYKNNKLVETSDWRPHIRNEEDNDSTSIDQYEIQQDLASGEAFIAYYYVRTINDLEVGPVISNWIQQGQIPFNQGAFTKYLVEQDPQDRENGRVKISIENATVNGYFRIYRNNILLKDFLIKQGGSITIYDTTVEHGATYKYYIQQYYNNIFSDKYLISKDSIFIEFDDAFLSDGERQLSIRFNPKVTSLKTTLAENKVDTIGSKYPSFFRNGIVGYKEFPISGLISCLIDPDSLFMALNPIGEDEQSHNLTHANFKRERDFKLEVLNWLNNGQPKLFRSPGEGNYLVRLMNVSLSPDEKLGRMLHTFSATAYEIADYSYSNLMKYGFLTKEVDETFGLITTIKTEEIVESEKEASIDFSASKSISQISIEAEPGISFKIDGQEFTMPHTGFYILTGELANNIKQISSKNNLKIIFVHSVPPTDLSLKNNNQEVVNIAYALVTDLEELNSKDVISIISLQIWGQGTEYKFIYKDETSASFICPYYVEYEYKDLINVDKLEFIGEDSTFVAVVKKNKVEEETT